MAGYSRARYVRTFDPTSSAPFKVSRSKIDLFIECPRCYYLSERLGVKRPSMAAFTLNIAVDALLKKEFDIHRKAKTTHPLMKAYKIDAVPFAHPEIDVWRENFVGIQHVHKETNLLVFGAVDDIWIGQDGKLMVVDYKATAKEGKVDKLDDTRWHNQYRRQMEVYQWLLRSNGFKTSSTGYFVYVNGKKDKESFDGKLEFDVAIIPYTGKDAWIEDVLRALKACLMSATIPEVGELCEYCTYRENAGKTLRATYVGATTPEKMPLSTLPKEKNIKKTLVVSENASMNQSLF